MYPRLVSRVLFPLLLSAGVAAQSSGGWSAAAQTSTSSLHSGSAGGTHEHVQITNNWIPGSKAESVTMNVVFFEPDGRGGFKESTITVEVPPGGTRSFHGDVKRVTVTAGTVAAVGTWAVTYP